MRASMCCAWARSCDSTKFEFADRRAVLCAKRIELAPKNFSSMPAKPMFPWPLQERSQYLAPSRASHCSTLCTAFGLDFASQTRPRSARRFGFSNKREAIEFFLVTARFFFRVKAWNRKRDATNRENIVIRAALIRWIRDRSSPSTRRLRLADWPCRRSISSPVRRTNRACPACLSPAPPCRDCRR